MFMDLVEPESLTTRGEANPIRDDMVQNSEKYGAETNVAPAMASNIEPPGGSLERSPQLSIPVSAGKRHDHDVEAEKTPLNC